MASLKLLIFPGCTSAELISYIGIHSLIIRMGNTRYFNHWMLHHGKRDDASNSAMLRASSVSD